MVIGNLWHKKPNGLKEKYQYALLFYALLTLSL